MPTLDDDSIDFPQAYKAIALLMRSIALSEEETDGLIEKIEVLGNPKLTPRDQINRAFKALDEEAK
jgi:translation initiation factor 4G